ncbi:cytochrome P450, cyclodipeptide synthase-associated [Marinomonas ostreistagni]|uniref:Cytochrome P450, cyclodipeptide synthase-associated n=1 Tax=Marinomonas ostreistagni TaxID=359209 RepID=A0ABS0ZD56_9GAMM|nr:cytochrome P450, cyclodipeptide synthase-associated [Marinomonas ostreistagni]MBJ7551600.1 cytochrome P450, cyclodipeptide synthase-associated [Marinomonas ostreistagni]
MSKLCFFDVLDPIFQKNPYPFYQALHNEDLIYCDKATGAYFVGEYAEVERILKDPSFTTAPLSVRAQPVMRDRVLAQMEGKEHSEKRRAVLHGLSGQYFKKQYHPLIKNISQELINPYLYKGSFDLVNEFGKDYAILVTLGILGLPKDNYKEIALWHKGVADYITKLNLSEEEKNTSLQYSKNLSDFLLPIIDLRKIDPRDDLISLLCNLNNSENIMTDSEIIALCLNILLAATEPADKSLAMLFKNLLEQPEVFDDVYNDRTKIRAAIEETLRLNSPVQLIPREASEDCIVGGISIKKGSIIFNMIGAANRDPKVFHDPNLFILDRRAKNKEGFCKKRHLAFGTGMHACLGAEFSLRQIEITANVILDSLKNLKISEEYHFSESGLYTRGPNSLLLTFDALPKFNENSIGNTRVKELI